MTYRIKVKELITAHVIANAIISAALLLAGATFALQSIENAYYIPTTASDSGIAPETLLLSMKFFTYSVLTLVFMAAAAMHRPRWNRWKK